MYHMKKLFLTLVFCCVGMSVFAGIPEKKHHDELKYEFRLGWATWPVMDVSVFRGNVLNYDMAVPDYSDLDNLYGNYSGAKYMTGLISGEFNMMLSRWFTLSFGLNMNGYYFYEYNGVTSDVQAKKCGVSMAVLPQARFVYLNRKYVRMYSSAGFGFSCYFLPGDNDFLPVFQVAPVGIMAGSRVFGFLEVGLGTMYCGCMAGVGFRF